MMSAPCLIHCSSGGRSMCAGATGSPTPTRARTSHTTSGARARSSRWRMARRTSGRLRAGAALTLARTHLPLVEAVRERSLGHRLCTCSSLRSSSPELNPKKSTHGQLYLGSCECRQALVTPPYLSLVPVFVGNLRETLYFRSRTQLGSGGPGFSWYIIFNLHQHLARPCRLRVDTRS
jgi:hypothetical protein